MEAGDGCKDIAESSGILITSSGLLAGNVEDYSTIPSKEIAVPSINWQRFGPSTACYLTLAGLCLYIASYACLVDRWLCPGSLGVFAWPQYSQNHHVDGVLQEIYAPIHRLDAKVRTDFWSYKCYQCRPDDAALP